MHERLPWILPTGARVAVRFGRGRELRSEGILVSQQAAGIMIELAAVEVVVRQEDSRPAPRRQFIPYGSLQAVELIDSEEIAAADRARALEADRRQRVTRELEGLLMRGPRDPAPGSPAKPQPEGQAGDRQAGDRSAGAP